MNTGVQHGKLRGVAAAMSSAMGSTALALALGALAASEAEARITRIEVKRVESPTFEGKTFGPAGAYEKLVGRAYGEVDPKDPRNAVIVDLDKAPKNARSMVEYDPDFYILKPVTWRTAITASGSR
jgi:hypothetical protein